jgi:sucrose synthase
MIEEIIDGKSKARKRTFFRYLNRVCTSKKKLMVKGELLEVLQKMKNKSKVITEENNKSKAAEFEELESIINKLTESFVLGSSVFVEVRESIGTPEHYHFNIQAFSGEKISSLAFLSAKEKVRSTNGNPDILTLNFQTFYDKFPKVRESKNIGRGVEYLNRYLSSNMFTNQYKLSRALFDFLFVHKHNSEPLIVNDRIDNPGRLSTAIDRAVTFLKRKDMEIPYSEIKLELQELGFEPGLGNTIGRILEMLQMLDSLLAHPDHHSLKEFLSRIPMIYNIAVISPHGYFGQDNVLGKPDTGGQIVYILDQVKALEKEITDSLELAGLTAQHKIIILTRLIPNAENTHCNVRLEKVNDAENVWILRVPFREHNKNVTDNWISRFEIWPYLEEFAEDSYKELMVEFGTKPDLIIGNYSDGNLVATILAKKFGVTQCNVAHALEKSKYLFSALFWDEMEQQYHFSTQYTADLLAMNAADFIITSTYQEIAGREDSIGQYESYINFTMPGLYRVTGGIDIFHPKFNIMPPGVDFEIFFPHYKKEIRIAKMTEEVENLFFMDNGDFVIGELKNPTLPPIFSIARLDKIKNLTSLVKWYGESEELKSIANLIVVAGKINSDDSSDAEEKEQIHLMHQYIEQYKLKDHLRWLRGDPDRRRLPEYYRVIADWKGIFVQPALFEGFGLTVIEAMRSGLPTFATKYGGPLEIIEDEISGFHIDPVDGSGTTEKIIKFFRTCESNPAYYEKISNRAVDRVDKTYNWSLYSKNLLSLAKIYGFWKYTSNLEMTELNAYLDLLYHTLYKPRAKAMLEIHKNR